MIAALAAGVAVYYLQVYGFYRGVDAGSDASVIRLTGLSGVAEAVPTEAFEGIDADSSPIRFRACFTIPLSQAMLSETFAPYDGAEPRIAPTWFSCFDAEQIGADIENGRALTFLSEKNIQPGFDRVVAVYPDGRAFAWHQPNESAEQ